ncbi:hypothetical protein DL764_002186 [Monosporascus ibericus]|uniref:Saccharopine dehydrogenase NADP binding domain-containing protein n=1 Tax=Monosporascus ibericus TaxID=155417 RepID=A0A4Q4TMR1_9PEZI|nr:hypothetical protein DL764_002186 [Monosporascus ibericus]
MMRDLDIILVGATGYTGLTCASYISTRLPASLRWGVAGRDRSKLEKLAETLAGVENASKPVLLPIDVKSKDDVDVLVKKTKVVISVVGPYAVAGSYIFEACARNGTHYLDCNGEVPWLQDMIKQNEQAAKNSGSMMIPCCGFAVVPADLSTYLLAAHLRRSSVPLTTSLVCCHDFVGAPSGGTVLSALNTLSQYGIKRTLAACEPFALSPVKPGYLNQSEGSMSGPRDDFGDLLGKMSGFGVQNSEVLGTLITSPQDDVDRAVLTRSWGLLSTTEKAYSSDFYYSGSRVRYDSALAAWSGRASYISTILLAASPLRAAIRRYWYDAGEGPSEEERKKGLLEFRSIGVGKKAQGREDGDEKEVAMCKMSFAGDLYLFTALCLSEAAMVLLDGVTEAQKMGGGVWTCAFLGEDFAERLQAAGVKIETISI